MVAFILLSSFQIRLNWIGVLLGLLAFFGRAGAQRRVNFQSAVVNNTLFLHGGENVFEDGTRADLGPHFQSVNLSKNFAVSVSPHYLNHRIPSDVPNVASGTFWSNELNLLWLYGGFSTNNVTVENSLWRFTLDNGQEEWSQVQSNANRLPRARPAGGASCNVPSRAKGFYLGGYDVTDASSDPDFDHRNYLHSMVIFDMESETIKTVKVPDFVPVLGPGLVYIETGDGGALVALGGYTNKNGVLNLAPMGEVYIYDLAHDNWIIQQTTSVTGDHNTLFLDPMQAGNGIPPPRSSLCTAVQPAMDRSSFNIFALGALNKTVPGGPEAAPDGDAWVLSLPSAVWIRLPLADITNLPKWGSSCNSLHSRYVYMEGGCVSIGNMSCKSYGYNPLLFDPSNGNWAWGNDRFRGSANFSLPRQITSIIGGNEFGNSSQRDPSFTKFGDPRLKQMFTPPNAEWPEEDHATYYNASIAIRVAASVLPILCSTAFLVLFGPIMRRIKKSHSRDWSPWALRPYYTVTLLALTVSLLVLVIEYWNVSTQPDRNPQHWNGGLVEDGHWTGLEFNSTFIPAPNSGIPEQGIIYFYLDKYKEGPWNLKNSTIRVTRINYILWAFFPSIISVLYGLLWTVLDGEVKRMEKYKTLARRGGEIGFNTLCVDYHSFWTPLAILQGIRHRQLTVVLSSIGSTLSTIVVPNLQSYVFEWRFYSGGQFTWGVPTFAWQTASFNTYWTKVLIAVLAMIIVCLLGIIAINFFQSTGLKEEIYGLGGVAELTLGRTCMEFGLDVNDDQSNLQTIHKKVGVGQYRLQRENEQCRICAVSQPIKKSHIEKLIASVPSKKAARSFHDLRLKVHAQLKRMVDPLGSWIGNDPTPISFRRAPMMLWLLVLAVLVGAAVYILAVMSQTDQMSKQNYNLPWPSNLYLIVGVFIQSFYLLIERQTRAMCVLDSLRRGYQPPDVLYDDFTFGVPFFEIYFAFKRGYHLLGYVLLGSVVTMLYTIMLGSLQASASVYGASSFREDRVNVILVLCSSIFIFAVSLGVAFRFWNAAFLPRYPGTLASILPYVLSSEYLRMDLEQVASNSGRSIKVQHLKELGRRYSFGNFNGAQTSRGSVRHLGVERAFTDGAEGPEHVSAPVVKATSWI